MAHISQRSAAPWARAGAKCVCVPQTGGRWKCKETGQRTTGPERGERLAVAVRRIDEQGNADLSFAGYPDVFFNAAWFRPLIEKSLEEDVALFAPLLTSTGEVRQLVDAGAA